MVRRSRSDEAPTGPAQMVLVRHAESVGNVANSEAHDRGAGHLALGERDADVPLTGTGVRQARAIGAFLAEMHRRE